MKKGIIHYGFGKDYLKNWGISEALREIYQNFLDYGEYEEIRTDMANDVSEVSIMNAWLPENLEFLRIGNSQKNNPDAIGKHGEGLKMAFLILLREGFYSRIMTPKYAVYPLLYQDDEIGECFCFEYEEHGLDNQSYQVRFQVNTDLFKDFRNNIITKADVIYDDHYYGQMVNKDAGNIYSGGLFVAKVDNLSAAYNIKPAQLPLDRDRCVPRAIDVNYAASKIKEAHGKLSVKDFSYSDTMFVSRVPEEVKKQIKPVRVGNSIEYTFKDEAGKTNIISNESVKTSLKNDSFFASIIKRLKKAIAKQLGLYEMLIEFQKKYLTHLPSEAKVEFELILERTGKK